MDYPITNMLFPINKWFIHKYHNYQSINYICFININYIKYLPLFLFLLAHIWYYTCHYHYKYE